MESRWRCVSLEGQQLMKNWSRQRRVCYHRFPERTFCEQYRGGCSSGKREVDTFKLQKIKRTVTVGTNFFVGICWNDEVASGPTIRLVRTKAQTQKMNGPTSNADARLLLRGLVAKTGENTSWQVGNNFVSFRDQSVGVSVEQTCSATGVCGLRERKTSPTFPFCALMCVMCYREDKTFRHFGARFNVVSLEIEKRFVLVLFFGGFKDCNIAKVFPFFPKPWLNAWM